MLSKNRKEMIRFHVKEEIRRQILEKRVPVVLDQYHLTGVVASHVIVVFLEFYVRVPFFRCFRMLVFYRRALRIISIRLTTYFIDFRMQALFANRHQTHFKFNHFQTCYY
jgi:hypothetical protein